jgi:hypothetical protein
MSGVKEPMTQKLHLIRTTVSPNSNTPELSSKNMKFRSTSRDADNQTSGDDASVTGTIPFPRNQRNGNGNKQDEGEEETTLIKTVGWISAGLGAVALGLFIGRELRQRYQFNRRTPYDFYAHSGDEQDVDFGLGT